MTDGKDPSDEAARLSALERYRIMDSGREREYDDIVAIAAEVCGARMALICFVDGTRQWFKASVGLSFPQTSLGVAFCAHAIRQSGVFVVEDASADPRFAQNPLVTGDPNLRFYAGAPLETQDGHALGTVCVLDSEPHRLSKHQELALQALSRQVMGLLELRRLNDALRTQIDARDRAEANLRIQDQKTQELSKTWNLSPDLWCVLDSQGFFERSNPAWTTTLGWSAEEMKTIPFIDLIHPDDISRTHSAWDEALSGQPVLRFENRYRCKSGDYRWLSWVAVPEEGKVHCNARDVTEEKAQSQELIVQRAERDRAWRLSQDLLVIAAKDGTITAINEAWSRLLGWTEAELVGIRFTAFTHPDDLATTLDKFVGILDTPLTEPYEYRFRHKEGTYRWFAWTAAFENGSVYASGRHTTEEHLADERLQQTEYQLRQAQKMEAVGQLTGGLAHDFNNLLAGMMGSMEVIRTQIERGRMTEILRYVEVALGAGRRAASLTQRLLAFSRQQSLDPKVTDINRLLAGMEELLRRSIGPEIELEIVGAAGLWTALVDSSQLENSILNLCLNARDAMPEGGRVTVETANKWLDDRVAAERELPVGQYVSICVTDTGVGMSPEVIARAFDPFFTTKPIGQGTGLGLSMIYGFAKQSGGQVRIYSEIGRGTTLCIYLPRNLESPQEAETSDSIANASSYTGGGEVVLVIDDEASVRMLISEVLAEAGYAAIEVGDGPSGLRILKSNAKIDLLITDVGLPGGMNGRQVADAARVLRPNLKVLFITGYAENSVFSRKLLEPGMHLLTKPFPMEDLARRIRQILVE